MSLQSMTGFARSSASAPWRLAWEIKSVNAKGLDLRLRMPPGFDALEQEARNRHLQSSRAAPATRRSRCTARAPRRRSAHRGRAGEPVEAIGKLPASDNVRPASLDGLLAVRGVVDIVDSTDSKRRWRRSIAAALAELDEALDGIVAMRSTEGEALHKCCRRLDAMPRSPTPRTRARAESPTRCARGSTRRSPRSCNPRRSRSGAAASGSDALAAKADIREELDRLKAHVAAARELLAAGEPVGRRLDFLAQELGRETNTLCAKSNDPALTRHRHGAASVEVEQLREQVQNIE